MRRFLIAAAAASAMALTVSSGASAASTPGQMAAPKLAAQSLIEQAQFGYGYRKRCRRWHRTCRYRWGYGWRYRRCMRIHGC